MLNFFLPIQDSQETILSLQSKYFNVDFTFLGLIEDLEQIGNQEVFWWTDKIIEDNCVISFTDYFDNFWVPTSFDNKVLILNRCKHKYDG